MDQSEYHLTNLIISIRFDQTIQVLTKNLFIAQRAVKAWILENGLGKKGLIFDKHNFHRFSYHNLIHGFPVW